MWWRCDKGEGSVDGSSNRLGCSTVLDTLIVVCRWISHYRQLVKLSLYFIVSCIRSCLALPLDAILRNVSQSQITTLVLVLFIK